MNGTAADPGTARERTSQAWTRTALALLVNGLLVMARHDRAFPLPVSAVLAGGSLAAALVVLAYAARRSRTAAWSGPGAGREAGPATRFVVPLGIAVTLLCVTTGIAIVGWH